MTGSDDEFDDFLRRRKPIFRRDDDDGLEPPAELDRIVLRQAREAIEPERPQRVFRAPRWGAPIALAATIMVALSVVLHVGLPAKGPTGEVTVQNISREIVAPAEQPLASPDAQSANAEPTAADQRERAVDSGAVVVELAPLEHAELARTRAPEAVAAAPPAPRGFVSDAEASRYAPPLPMAPSAEVAAPAVAYAGAERVDATGANLAKAAPEGPAWRRDSKTWLAEIERLRAAGDTAQADAEMAEYNRQQRAFAGAPDR